MLYRTIQRLILSGQTVGLEEKLDVFYAADKLSRGEYEALLLLLRENAQ